MLIFKGSFIRLARFLFHFRNACTFYIKTSISIQLEHTKGSSIRVMNPAWGQLLTRSNPIFRFLRRSYRARPCIEARNFLLRRLSHFPEETGRDRWPRRAVCQDMPANIQLSRAVHPRFEFFPRDSFIVIGFPFLMINLVTDESLMCINATVKIVLENSTFVFYFLFSNLIKFSFKILMSLASIQNDSWKLYFHFLFSNVIKFSFNDVILINLNINQQKVENFFVYGDVVLIIQFFKFVFQRLISPLLNFERTFKTFVIWRWFKVCR